MAVLATGQNNVGAREKHPGGSFKSCDVIGARHHRLPTFTFGATSPNACA